MTDLINTTAASGEFDPLVSLRPGEPYFALVGRDRLAPKLVQEWADENRNRALDEYQTGKIDAEKRDRELRKSTQAEAVGWEMTAWKAGQIVEEKRADAGGRPTYSGHVEPEDSKRRNDILRLRAETVAALTNAVAVSTELLELLDEETIAKDPDLDLLNAKLSLTIATMEAAAEKAALRRVGTVG